MGKTVKGICVGLLIASSAFCRDFPQAFEITDPLFEHEDSDSWLIPRGYAEVRFCDHGIHPASNDLFDVYATAAFTVFDAGGKLAMNIYWGNYFMAAPLDSGEASHTVMDWAINTSQYEYGVIAAFPVRSIDVSLEYSRTCQHPWRPLQSEYSSDAIKGGLTIPKLRFGPLSLDIRCMAGYLTLFDFWSYIIPKPRADWVASPAVFARFDLTRTVAVYARQQIDAMILREGGGDVNYWGELGFEIGSGRARSQFYLDCLLTNDTEDLRYEACPARIVGFGVRMYK